MTHSTRVHPTVTTILTTPSLISAALFSAVVNLHVLLHRPCAVKTNQLAVSERKDCTYFNFPCDYLPLQANQCIYITAQETHTDRPASRQPEVLELNFDFMSDFFSVFFFFPNIILVMGFS